MRLGVNIDHIAYLREVRKINDPDPINALHIAKLAGASQITIHLREDRRHIHDRDVENIMRLSQIPVNIECANEKSILDFICSKKPSRITLVPEKREEITTEGGLLVGNHLLQTLDFIKNNDIEVALFIDPNKAVIEEVVKLSEQIQSDIALELHTGRYANLYLMTYSNLSLTQHSITEFELSKSELRDKVKDELENLRVISSFAKSAGLHVFAGHGLDYNNVLDIVGISDIEELNIGQSIIARAIFVGLERAIRDMVALLH